jgi:hypothetical protein
MTLKPFNPAPPPPCPFQLSDDENGKGDECPVCHQDYLFSYSEERGVYHCAECGQWYWDDDGEMKELHPKGDL